MVVAVPEVERHRHDVAAVWASWGVALGLPLDSFASVAVARRAEAVQLEASDDPGAWLSAFP